ncbi:hypothetical protein ASG12_15500 [Williamsia sp. Leaf354]|nr:hypothetical protein ASG12_15500 [Williamsia sp. Leaf354]
MVGGWGHRQINLSMVSSNSGSPVRADLDGHGWRSRDVLGTDDAAVGCRRVAPSYKPRADRSDEDPSAAIAISRSAEVAPDAGR